MNIRNGTYTLINNIEMALTEYYGHGLDPEIASKHRILSYSGKLGELRGFELFPEADEYRMDVLVTDLNNAFKVNTIAKYKGKIFRVDSIVGNGEILHLATSDLKLGKEMGFYELHDIYGKPYYLGEVNIRDIENIWEERTRSEYELPIPAGLELVKELDLSDFI